MLAADWQNPARSNDVNNDMRISPTDALLVINDLNQNGGRSLAPRPHQLAPYLDTSGDTLLTATDALKVIDKLNSRQDLVVFPLEGESETAPAGFISVIFAQLPGDSTQIVELSSQINIVREEFNEIGLFIMDSPEGEVNGIAPTSPLYSREVFAQAQRRVLYSRLGMPDVSRDVVMPAGSTVGVYVLQGASDNGNPEDHMRVQQTGTFRHRIGWEEHVTDSPWGGVGDRSYDDVLVDIQIGNPQSSTAEPLITAIPNQSVDELVDFVFDVVAGDANLPNDILTFTLDQSPSGMTITKIDNSTARIRWTPTEQQGPGVFNVNVRATDSTGLFDIESFTISVAETNPATDFSISEQSSFLTQQQVDVELGQNEGTRSISFRIAPRFDTTDRSSVLHDTLAVYLVDPLNPSQTLLDRGTSGTALFTLSNGEADFLPGLVRYDGDIVSIDVTSLADKTTGRLLFQLLNTDNDNGSNIKVSRIQSIVDAAALIKPTFNDDRAVANPGPTQDISAFVVATDVKTNVRNIRFNSSTGKYNAELSLVNEGASLGRQVAIAFSSLPPGVTFGNASGTDVSNRSYINFASAIPSGGLLTGTESSPVLLEVLNPDTLRFALSAVVLAAGPNRAPTVPQIPPITIKPGEVYSLQLPKQDPDGDQVTYKLESDQALPSGQLNGRLEFRPTPQDIGSYSFTLVATDGSLETRRNISLNVIADSITTTRISGQILDVDQNPLIGMRVEVGSVAGLTGNDGSFQLDLGSGIPVADTLRVRGELFSGPNKYPFIAEKLPLVLEHAVFPSINNVITRPIYLPKLDIANGVKINPTQDTLVTTTAIPGASVLVRAGTLMNQQSTLFSDVLSITQVPPNLTPASLPSNLRPDMVLTIQPGEMVFTAPAPLTFPNSANYDIGTILDLWSINPVTGQFDDVGDMQVFADSTAPGGSIIQTTSGGVRNSSWHFPAPPDPEPEPDDDGDEDDDCDECKDTNGNFEVESHSGALLDDHRFVTYQSMGQTQGFALHYDSKRADPRPIVHINYSNLIPQPNQRLVAALSFMKDGFEFEMPGYEGDLGGLQGGEHFWKLDVTGTGRVALQADLSSMETGVYSYELRSGPMQFDGTRFTGTLATQTKELRVVNSINSPFGSGWGMQGLLEIVENADGSLLLIDGGGSELYFGKPTSQGQPYVNPPGNFTRLIKIDDGTFQQTLTDNTVVRFNTANRISTRTDRNGNVWRFQYDSNNILSKITDPAGMETQFTVVAGRITSIVDPANRITRLEYDADGNLIRVIDPDQTSKAWKYDESHRIIAETDKRGFTERVAYDFAGRANKSIRSNGTELRYNPVQTQVLRPFSETIDPVNSPSVSELIEIKSSFADANGNVTEALLDKQGQARQTRDSEGRRSNVFRNAQNLVTTSADGRGFTTDMTYDAQGNVLSVTDRVGSASGGSLFVTGHDSDDHANGEYQRAGLDFLTFGREASTQTELSFRSEIKIGYLGTSDGSQAGADESGYTDRTFIDLDLATWPTTAFNGEFDILMIGTGGDFVSGQGSDSLNSQAAKFAEFFNEGGGIFVNTDNASLGQEFYNFLPAFGATQAAVGGTGVYSVTPDGLLIGLTEAIVDADPTHTEYKNVDPNLFRVFETHNQTGDPVAIGLFQGFIGGGLGGLATSFMKYDPNFAQVTEMTDGRGEKTVFDLDASNGNVSIQRRVVGNVDTTQNGETDDLVTRYTYTTFALIDTVTDPLGRVTDYDYDSRGRLTSVTYAKGTADEAIMRYEYDLAGNQTAMIDGNGNRTTYEYDLLNRMVKTTEADPDGAGPLLPPVTTFVYDVVGNVTSTTDANGSTSSSRFDDLNRLIESTGPDPDGTGPLPAPITRYTYDPVGNLDSVTDPNGNTTRYQYDGRNRRVESIDPDGGITKFTYDSDNNLSQVTDPVGNVTKFRYDARDRLVEEIDPLGKSILYGYDAANNLVQKTDRNGRVTKYSYDDLNRLIKEEWIGAADAVVNTITYRYDFAGNLLSVDDKDSKLTYVYDARNRVKSVDNTGTPGAPSVILTYAYDDNSNVLSVTDTINAALGATTSYTYDALDRLVVLGQSGNQVSNKRVNFTYNALGQYSAIDRYRDLAGTQLVIGTDYSYDLQNRLTLIDHKNAANTSVAFYDYEYDIASRISKITDIDGATNYEYDDRDQLIRADHADAVFADESYTYDANGNRTNSHLHGSGYVTGPGNRLLSDGNYNYEYDNEGNMTKRTEIATGNFRTFEWDHRNRLTQLSDNRVNGVLQQFVRYAYDALGRRISKQVDTSPVDAVDANIEQYVSDGDDVILDFLDSDGAGPATSRQTTRYLRGPSIDDLLAIESTNETAWVLQDHLGSTRAIVSSDGIMEQTIDYDVFGKPIFNGVLLTRFLFTGREFDAESGLSYYRARFYDSSTGRFIGEDPIRFASGEHAIYRYVFNNPISLRDPSGLSPSFGECLANCIAKELGLDSAAAAATAASGLPVIPKPRGGFAGSSSRTSIASSGLSKVFPQRLPFSLPAPTLNNPLARTRVVGRFIGRWIPGVGWALLAYDAISIAKCTSECQDDEEKCRVDSRS